MTFEPHPREFFAPDHAPARVAGLRDKIAGLQAAGIERVFVFPFHQRLASLDAQRFIDEVLVGGCAVRWIMVGDDFRFGAKRTGNVELLQANAARAGFEVHQLPSFLVDGHRVSSSLVRAALAAGRMDEAQRLLGHAYRMTGRIIHGARLGRQIGFPTINLRLGHGRHPAVHGIFAVRVYGLGGVLDGVASAGFRPTVDDTGRWLLEVHLFDFNQDVYGRLVQVEFLRKLRDERKYDSLEALTVAIQGDVHSARAVLAEAGPARHASAA